MLTGFIDFNEITYFFHLTEDVLTMSSTKRGKQDYKDLFFEVSGREEDTPSHIEGESAGSKTKIIFFIRNRIIKSMGEYRFRISSYLLYDHDHEAKPISRISIQCKELDSFYKIHQAYTFEVTDKTGEMSLNLSPLDSNRYDFKLLIDNKNIDAVISISRNFTTSSNSPVTLNSTITYTFEGNNDYAFIKKIINLTRDFLRFTTYRKNIAIDQVILKEKNESGMYQKFGRWVFPADKEMQIENDRFAIERIIDSRILKGNVSNLFQLFVSGQVYMEHIPQDSIDKNIITPARFILITAGFEWEFRSSFGNIKAAENSMYKEIQTDILSHIDELIENNSGKKKKYARTFQKIVSNSGMSLSEKILKVLGDEEGILNKYIQGLYALNKIKDVKHSDIAERLQQQRNNYAHGNIDKELNYIVILDLLVLEWVIYVLVLRKAKLSDQQIDHAINKLFSRNQSLEPLKD